MGTPMLRCVSLEASQARVLLSISFWSTFHPLRPPFTCAYEMENETRNRSWNLLSSSPTLRPFVYRNHWEGADVWCIHDFFLQTHLRTDVSALTRFETQDIKTQPQFNHYKEKLSLETINDGVSPDRFGDWLHNDTPSLQLPLCLDSQTSEDP